jgi:hypothetical protein
MEQLILHMQADMVVHMDHHLVVEALEVLVAVLEITIIVEYLHQLLADQQHKQVKVHLLGTDMMAVLAEIKEIIPHIQLAAEVVLEQPVHVHHVRDNRLVVPQAEME